MIGSLLQWWYTDGWKVFANGLGQRLRNTADFFSIGILVKTLFAPFRQISANGGGTRLQAFFDRLFSRIMGCIVRIFIILAGIISLIFQAVFGVILAVVWPLIPLSPVVCVILAVIGVTL